MKRKAFAIILLFMCGDKKETDRIHPEVISLDPQPGTILEVEEVFIRACVSESVEPLTFYVKDENLMVEGDIFQTSSTCVEFHPKGELKPDTTYIAAFLAVDKAGNASHIHVWSFSTGPTEQIIPSLVKIGTTPVPGEKAFPEDGTIFVKVEGFIDPYTLDFDTIKLIEHAPEGDFEAEIAVGWDPENGNITIFPLALASQRYYTLKITGISDTKGVILPEKIDLSFRVRDLSPPWIEEIYPPSEKTGCYESPVPITKVCTKFTEEIDSSSITFDTFRVYKADQNMGLIEVVGSIYYEDEGEIKCPERTACFFPTEITLPEGTYFSILLRDIKDLSGNSLADTFMWCFKAP